MIGDNRNSDRDIELRKAWADEWALKMDNLARNSVFTDEAGLLYSYDSKFGLVKKRRSSQCLRSYTKRNIINDL